MNCETFKIPLALLVSKNVHNLMSQPLNEYHSVTAYEYIYCSSFIIPDHQSVIVLVTAECGLFLLLL